MRRRRIGADDDDDVAVFDRVEVLRAGRGAVGLAEAVAGRRMADAGTGVDVVVAEDGADQLLHQESFFIGAARRGDAANRGPAVFLLNALELGSSVGDRLVPAHFLPRLVDRGADHWVEDALLVGRIAPGETALDAGVAAIGLAVLVRHHAHNFLAAHFGLERAADAAISAGGNDRVFGLADLDNLLLVERRGRAGLHASAAGHAFRTEETLFHAGGDAAAEAAAGDGQREGALHFLAGAHAARANDALRRLVGEVRIRLVLRQPVRVAAFGRLGEDVVLAFIAVAHVVQAFFFV